MLNPDGNCFGGVTIEQSNQILSYCKRHLSDPRRHNGRFVSLRSFPYGVSSRSCPPECDRLGEHDDLRGSLPRAAAVPWKAAVPPESRDGPFLAVQYRSDRNGHRVDRVQNRSLNPFRFKSITTAADRPNVGPVRLSGLNGALAIDPCPFSTIV